MAYHDINKYHYCMKSLVSNMHKINSIAFARFNNKIVYLNLIMYYGSGNRDIPVLSLLNEMFYKKENKPNIINDSFFFSKRIAKH